MNPPLVRRLGATIVFTGCLLGLATGSARGDYTVERVLDGLNQPIYVTQAPGDQDSLYIVERTDGGNQLGRIRRYDMTTHTLSTFLDVTGSWVGDGGMFSMTFHPDYESNGLFYITYTEGGSNRLEEYEVMGGTPQFQRRILEYPALNNVFHNINQAFFRPVGNNNEMFVTTGDGGTQASEGGFDPALIENPDSIYGKIMRIDLTADFSTPANATTHPGIGVVALGIRNPYRGSFDRATGDFYFGDVGFNVAEEVDFIPASHFANPAATPLDFGWTSREGTVATSPAPPGGPGTPGVDIEPIFDYPHPGRNVAHPAEFLGNAVAGGYVYRGPVPELQGRYFVADFVNGNVYSGLFDTNTNPTAYNGTNLTDIQNHTVAFENEVGGGANIQWVSSFGEDLAGNLYILKFGNSFTPANGLGEIFRIVPSVDVTVTVNRDTGQITFSNDTGEITDILDYSLTSAEGEMNTNVFTPIAGRLDNSTFGDGSIDPTNEWQITSVVGDHAEFSEESTGGAASLAVGPNFELSPSGGWIQSIYENIDLRVTLGSGVIAKAIVEYVGNGGQPFQRSDLDFNGNLEPADWNLFRAQHGQSFPGMSIAQSYGMGDLDGDFDNDFGDFRLFQADYIAANGAAAFAALLNVPEPATVVLLAMVVGVLPFVRFRNRRGASQGNWRPFFFLRAAGQSAAKITASLAVVAALAALPSRCEAQIVHQYSFNEPATADATGMTIIDSVGGANGTVLGAGSSATGTQLVLPGGSSATQAYVDLPNGIVSSLTDATFEAWYTQTAANAWSRIFDFGSTDIGGGVGGELNAPGGGGQGLDYIFYAPSRGTDINAQRLGIRNLDPLFGGAAAGNVTDGEDRVDPEFGQSLNVEYHVAVVYDADGGAAPGDARMTLYINGAPAFDLGGTNPQDTSIQLGNLNDVNNWLGRSNWTGDQNLGGSLNEIRIYDVALTAEQVEASYQIGPVPVDFLELTVNTFTGDVSVSNEYTGQLSFDYYRVASAQGALNPGGWMSLDAQNADAISPDPGENWDEAGNPDANQVSELYLLGASMLNPAESRQLGSLFDPSVFGIGQDGDLVFQFALQGSNNLVTGAVNYIVPSTLPGDYNGDGSVNAADYTVYRNHLGEMYKLLNEVDGVSPGMVTVDDYNEWKARYGNMLGVGSGAAVGQSTAVPEPASALLLVVTGLASISVRFRTRQRRRIAS